ncbi:fimbrial protein [Lelliottia sp. CFBP8978]|uniref:fimbrial protein n=1 Tax=Lelliottia sp. CFBP8978 TaxID=3096522 RepID=UPI002A6B1DB2|nr:fimbrial protein [Lelliottia sp. CFBP8978]
MRKLNAFLFVLISVLVPLFCWAAGDMSIINITGKITSSSCKVDGDSLNVPVKLGSNIQSNDLSKAESSTPWVDFHLKVISCPESVTQATVTFTGKADTANPESMYSNDGTAENVAIELQGSGGEDLGNGKSLVGKIDVDHTHTFDLQARVYSAKGNATGGNISSAVTATFTYQ